MLVFIFLSSLSVAMISRRKNARCRLTFLIFKTNLLKQDRRLPTLKPLKLGWRKTFKP